MSKHSVKTNKTGQGLAELYWQELEKELSGDRAKLDITDLHHKSRWFSADTNQTVHEMMAKLMKQAGLSQVQIVNLPADGKTTYGGWLMPKLWISDEATLDIVSPKVGGPHLACFTDVPMSLMMWSAPTSKKGVTAEVVLVKGDPNKFKSSVKGKFVFMDKIGRMTMRMGYWALKKGALGLICDSFSERQFTTEEEFRDNTLWHNATIPFSEPNSKLFGFSLTPRRGQELRELMAKNKKVLLHARVDTRFVKSTFPLVTGVLEGQTKEEIVVTGHLDEPGANDNLSGCTLGLEIARSLGNLVKAKRIAPLKRSIRLVYSMEVRGLQALLNQDPDKPWPWGKPVAGLNLDMVGVDQDRARTRIDFGATSLDQHTFAEVLLYDLMQKATRERARLGQPHWEHHYLPGLGGENDNQLADPKIGTPFVFMIQGPDRDYHSHSDKPEIISPAILKLHGLIAGTWLAFLAQAGPSEAKWLAQLIEESAKAEMRRPDKIKQSEEARWRKIQYQSLERFKSLGLLTGRQAMPVIPPSLIPKPDMEKESPPTREELELEAMLSKFIPIRHYVGFVRWWEQGAQGPSDKVHQLLRKTSMRLPYMWLRNVLWLADGKRSLAQIRDIMTREATSYVEWRKDLLSATERWKVTVQLIKILAGLKHPLITYKETK